MGLYMANFSTQHATRHHSADVGPRCMLSRPCRVHIRSGRMRCVAAAPSTVDSKTRPGEKKGRSRILHKRFDYSFPANQPRPSHNFQT